LVTFSFTGFSGLEEFLVAGGKDGPFFTGEFVSWGDVADLGDIDVPVLVGCERLHKTAAFERGLRLPGVEQASALEDAISARRAHRHDVAIKHHEGQPAIALQREFVVELDDRILLPLLEPVITGNEHIVFVGFAVAISPLSNTWSGRVPSSPPGTAD
jgi:hypothetical protein